MTLAEMIELAAHTLTAPTIEERSALGLALARGFMDRLGESQPCHMEAPMVMRGDLHHPTATTTITTSLFVLDANEADAYAAMILTAADTARAEQGEGK